MKVVFDWQGVLNFWEGRVENRAKTRKKFPGLILILQFFPFT